MTRIITTAAATAAIALAMVTPADAGGRGKIWKRILLGAIVAGIAGPAYAGGNGYYNDDGYRWRSWDEGRYPGANGYYGRPVGGNGYPNGGYRPPPPRPPTVAVEPAVCDRQDTVFVPRFNGWMCRPVEVPRANGGY